VDLERLSLMWWDITEEEQDARCQTCRLPLEIGAGQDEEDEGVEDLEVVYEWLNED
jgi:hypothetical protein